ncbi:MAG: hypothetical protein AAF902_15865 [Chloroflexota bacterium]
MIISLGAEKGSAFLVAFTVGNWRRTLKGKDMFLTWSNKMFGRG